MYACRHVCQCMHVHAIMHVCMYARRNVGMYACMAGWLAGWMGGWMDGWMHGWMDGWMDECMNVWMYERMNVWMYECMNVWMYECMNVWMYVWMNEWMNECMNVCMYVCMYVCMCIKSKIRKRTHVSQNVETTYTWRRRKGEGKLYHGFASSVQNCRGALFTQEITPAQDQWSPTVGQIEYVWSNKCDDPYWLAQSNANVLLTMTMMFKVQSPSHAQAWQSISVSPIWVFYNQIFISHPVGLECPPRRALWRTTKIWKHGCIDIPLLRPARAIVLDHIVTAKCLNSLREPKTNATTTGNGEIRKAIFWDSIENLLARLQWKV